MWSLVQRLFLLASSSMLSDLIEKGSRAIFWHVLVNLILESMRHGLDSTVNVDQHIGLFLHTMHWSTMNILYLLVGVTGLLISAASPTPTSFSAMIWKEYFSPSCRRGTVNSSLSVRPYWFQLRLEPIRPSTMYRIILQPPSSTGGCNVTNYFFNSVTRIMSNNRLGFSLGYLIA